MKKLVLLVLAGLVLAFWALPSQAALTLWGYVHEMPGAKKTQASVKVTGKHIFHGTERVVNINTGSGPDGLWSAMIGGEVIAPTRVCASKEGFKDNCMEVHQTEGSLDISFWLRK